jgi:hypothetical protein
MRSAARYGTAYAGTVRAVPQSTGLDRPGDLFRLWVEFDVAARVASNWRTCEPGKPFVIGVTGGRPIWWDGCGVSGYDEDDCLALLREQVFEGQALPPILRWVPSVDVSTLPKDVRHAIGVSVYRGVWFPARNRRPPD